MMSMLEDLAGERLKIRPTSSNVTGDSVSSREQQWEGNDKSLGTDTDNECNVSLTESRSLTISNFIFLTPRTTYNDVLRVGCVQRCDLWAWRSNEKKDK